MITTFFKRIFCKHNYRKIDYKIMISKEGLRYSYRLYECVKCGKQIWEDSRFDPINRP